MLKELLLYAGSAIVAVWGIAHVALPTKAVIRGFGPISQDNRRIFLMEWIMEGLTLCFIGALIISITVSGHSHDLVSTIVYRTSGLMLLLMAAVSLFTGARTAGLPMKFCPPVFTGVALMYFAASVL